MRTVVIGRLVFVWFVVGVLLVQWHQAQQEQYLQKLIAIRRAANNGIINNGIAKETAKRNGTNTFPARFGTAVSSAMFLAPETTRKADGQRQGNRTISDRKPSWPNSEAARTQNTSGPPRRRSPSSIFAAADRYTKSPYNSPQRGWERARVSSGSMPGSGARNRRSRPGFFWGEPHLPARKRAFITIVCADNTMQPPLISVLTGTTASRHLFWRNVVRNFLHQTYPNKELIILGELGTGMQAPTCADERSPDTTEEVGRLIAFGCGSHVPNAATECCRPASPARAAARSI